MRKKPTEQPGAPAVVLRRMVGQRVEGPQLWLARRNGICRGIYGPHRIEFRADFYRVDGKPVCEMCWRTMSEAQPNDKSSHAVAVTHK